MNESSPRWPGTKGGPGLDFSAYRTSADGAITQPGNTKNKRANARPGPKQTSPAGKPASEATQAKPAEQGGQPPQSKPGEQGGQPPQAKPAEQGGQPPQAKPAEQGGQPPQAKPAEQGGQPPQAKPAEQGGQPPQAKPAEQGGQPPQAKPAEQGGQPPQAGPPRQQPKSEQAPPAQANPVQRQAKAQAAEETKQIQAKQAEVAMSLAQADRAEKARQEWESTPVKAGAVSGASPAASGGVPGSSLTVAAMPAQETGPEHKRNTRRTRKARLRVARVDPWSVMKTTFLFAIAAGIMLWVVTAVLWSVLAGSGTLDSINTIVNQVLGDNQNQFDVGEIISAQRVLGFAAVVAVIDVVIITAVATLMAFLYNLAATVMGGLEVTLAED